MNKNIDKDFQPHHISIGVKEMEGNNGKGRIILLPGSNSRAAAISKHFEDLKIVTHSRGHDFYYGHVMSNNKKIDVAVVSSGMGTPSTEIIVTELIKLGAQYILRVGSSGAMNNEIKTGDIVAATGAIRDEKSSEHYFPLEFPAISSIAWINTIEEVAKNLNMKDHVWFGPFHRKASFYGRQFSWGEYGEENTRYMKAVRAFGSVASEMEASMLFIMSQYYSIHAGAICFAIAHDEPAIDAKVFADGTKIVINFAIECVKAMGEKII